MPNETRHNLSHRDERLIIKTACIGSVEVDVQRRISRRKFLLWQLLTAWKDYATIGARKGAVKLRDLPERVILAAESQNGSPYVFGAWGELCKPAARKARASEDHPTIVSKCQVLSGKAKDCTGCKWNGDRMFDCRGFTYWCLREVDISLSGQGATSQYGMTGNWLERGDIDSMPECVCCVFVADGQKKSHTGLYIKNGRVIECSGEVRERNLSGQWTHYAIPKGLYTAEEIAEIRRNSERSKRILRRGAQGADVKTLQEALNDLGYSCGAADGIYGTKTIAAAKAFQADNGLTPDGVVGSKTWAAIESAADGQPSYRVTITVPKCSWARVQELIAEFPDAEYVAEG